MARATTRHSTPRGLLVPLLVLVWFLFTGESARAGVIESAIAAATQDAGTDQSSVASSTATQQQPVNAVISVRIDSPGDDGPITQTNTGGAAAGSTNGSSTEQGASGQPADQDSATGQDAASEAVATQDRPQNLVILIRINSPGNNGPIQQGNVISAGAGSGNVSDTSQGAAPTYPTAAATTPARAFAADSRPARPHAKKGPAKAHKAPHRAPHSEPVSTTASAPPPAGWQAEPSGAAAVTAVPATRHHAAAAGVRHAAPRSEQRAATTIGALRPVDLLGKLDPRPALATHAADNDLSRPVIMTLVALIAALLVALASRHAPAAARLVPRHRRQA